MKKIFLGLAFATISFLSSNVFAMGHPPVTITNIFRNGNNGNIVNIMFSDNARLEYNSTTNAMQFFAADGHVVNPIPGEISGLALRRIHDNGGLVGGIVGAVAPILPHAGAAVGAAVAYKLMNALFINALLSRVNIVDHEYWAHNCWAALERGGVDCIRAVLTCPVSGVSYLSTEVLVPVCVFLVLFVFIYKCLNDRVPRVGH